MTSSGRLPQNLSRLRGGWFVGPEEYEAMGYTLGLPPGFYAPNIPEIKALSEKLKSQNGIILPSMIQNQNSTRNNKKVVISNLPPGISEEIIKDRIMKAFQDSKTQLTKDDPIEQLQIDEGGNVAFIDFFSRRDAESAVALGRNVQYEGRELPLKWYVSQLHQITPSISTPKNFKPESLNSLIIESDDPIPSPELIKAFFESKSDPMCPHMFDINSIHICEGFNIAIVNLKDPKRSDYAAWIFHECEIGGVKCRINRCFKRDGDGPLSLDRQEWLKMSAYAGPSKMYTVVSPLLRSNPCIADILNSDVQTAVISHPQTEFSEDPEENPELTHLLIFNVAPETVMNDETFYKEIVSDISDECNEYGKVINATAQSMPLSHKCGYLVINIEFESSHDAKNVQLMISGRRYRGRYVITQLSDK